jgi:hypothetical protein
MKVKEVGHAGLHGWRERIADRTARSVSKRTPASEETLRALIGLGFLAASIYSLTRTARELLRRR